MSSAAGVTITVDADQPTRAVGRHLYGVFLEEINYGGVGGILEKNSEPRLHGSAHAAGLAQPGDNPVHGADGQRA